MKNLKLGDQVKYTDLKTRKDRIGVVKEVKVKEKAVYLQDEFGNHSRRPLKLNNNQGRLLKVERVKKED